jgi:hypothetical protein
MQLATNASLIGKFQDKAERNATLMANADKEKKLDLHVISPTNRTETPINVALQPAKPEAVASTGQVLVGRRLPSIGANINFECKV